MIKIATKHQQLILVSMQEVSDEWISKFNSSQNKQRIVAWCDDHRVTAKTEEKVSCIKYIIDKADTNTLSELEKMHKEFVEFVENLQLYDLPLQEENKPYDAKNVLKKDMEFVKKMIDTWDETEDRLGTYGATILGKDSDANIVLPCGSIGDRLLKQMFEAWLKEYDK